MHATTRWNFKPMALLAAVVVLGLVSAALSLANPPPHNHGGGEDPPSPELSVGYWLTYLGTFGGEDSEATEINDSGVAVGWAGFPNGEEHAFRVVPDVDVYYRDDNGDGLNDLMEDLNDLASPRPEMRFASIFL